MSTNIIFFLGQDSEAIAVWTDCQSVPRMGEQVILEGHDDLLVYNVKWLTRNRVEILLESLSDKDHSQ